MSQTTSSSTPSISSPSSTSTATSAPTPSWYQRKQLESTALGNAKKYLIDEYHKYCHIHSDSDTANRQFTKRQKEIQHAYTTLSTCYKNAIPVIGIVGMSTFIVTRRFIRHFSHLPQLSFTSGILAPSLLSLGMITISRHLTVRYCDSKLLKGNEEENGFLRDTRNVVRKTAPFHPLAKEK